MVLYYTIHRLVAPSARSSGALSVNVTLINQSMSFSDVEVPVD